MIVDKKFGETVKKYRKLKGMTQGDLAKAVGRGSKSTIHRIEVGDVSANVDMIKKLAAALDVSVMDLTETALQDDPETKAMRFVPYLMKADETTLGIIERILGMK